MSYDDLNLMSLDPTCDGQVEDLRDLADVLETRFRCIKAANKSRNIADRLSTIKRELEELQSEACQFYRIQRQVHRAEHGKTSVEEAGNEINELTERTWV